MHNTFRKCRKNAIKKIRIFFRCLCCGLCGYFKHYKSEKSNSSTMNDMQTIVSNELHLNGIDGLEENGKTQRSKTPLLNHVFSSKKRVKRRRGKKKLLRDRNNNTQAADSVSDAGTFEG